jgi:hypothetical protein
MATPFTPNKSKKAKHLQTAEKKVVEAIKALQTAKENAEHWTDFATITHFEKQLSEFLSSDKNQTGFRPYIKK